MSEAKTPFEKIRENKYEFERKIKNMPNYYRPEINQKYSNLYNIELGGCNSQTQEYIGRYKSYDNIQSYIHKIYTASRGDSPTIDPEKLKLEINNMIAKEKIYCENYFVVYHAAPMIFKLIGDIQTIIYHAKNNKHISENMMIFRMNKLENKEVVDSHSFYNYMAKKTYNMKLDRESWYKDLAISVNLNLFGGQPDTAESTLEFFIKSIDFSDDISQKIITSILTQFPLGKKTYDIYYNRIKKHHDKFYNYKKVILYQIFIRKNIINDILILTTPFGIPLELDPKTVLTNIQYGHHQNLLHPRQKISNIDSIVEDLNFIGDGRSPYFNKPAPGKYHSQMNAHSVDRISFINTTDLRNNIDHLQGRLIGVANKIITGKDADSYDNVFMFNYNNHFEDMTASKLDLYKIIIDLMLECGMNPSCTPGNTYLNRPSV